MPAFARVLCWLLSLMVTTAAAHAATPREIGEMVKAAMQQTFDSDASLRHYKMTVLSVDAVPDTAERLRGTASIRHEHRIHLVPVQIRLEGGKPVWTVEPEAFLFAAPEGSGAILPRP